METSQKQARQIIRHLKRGAFPPTGIEHCTVGREREAKQLAKALTEAESGFSRHLFLEASPGWGKSHLLSLADALASQRGFAVSWVTIDSYAHAFNHPTRYLHSFLENLRVPGVGTRGLVNLCSHWLRNSEKDTLTKWTNSRAPWEMRWALETMIAAQGETDGNLPDWYYDRLEGRDVQFKSGRAYFPVFFERLAAIISLVRAVGLKGVVLLFDELESIATLGQLRSRMLSYEVLNTLIDARRFPHSFFIFAATLDFGGRLQDDSTYASVYESEYPDGHRFITKWCAKEPNLASLKPINRSENRRLLKTILDIHEKAYAGKTAATLTDAFIDRFLEEATQISLTQREIIKSFVSIAEICQQHPNCNPGLQLFGESFTTDTNPMPLQETFTPAPLPAEPTDTPPDPLPQMTGNTPAALPTVWSRLVSELQEYTFKDSVPLTLADFVKARSISLNDLYANKDRAGWTHLLRDAGFLSSQPEPDEQYFTRLFVRLLALKDHNLLSLLAETARSGQQCQTIAHDQHLQLERLGSLFAGDDGQTQPGPCLCKRLLLNPHAREELAELAGLLASNLDPTTPAAPQAIKPPPVAPAPTLEPPVTTATPHTLVRCPHCQSPVRSDRLERHVARVHGASSPTQASPQPLTTATPTSTQIPSPPFGSQGIHVLRQGKVRGPIAIEHLQSGLKHQLFSADDLAWHPPLNNWTPLRAVLANPPSRPQPALQEPTPAHASPACSVSALVPCPRCQSMVPPETLREHLHKIHGLLGRPIPAPTPQPNALGPQAARPSSKALAPRTPTSPTLTRCDFCSAMVRADKLHKHIQHVHSKPTGMRPQRAAGGGVSSIDSGESPKHQSTKNEYEMETRISRCRFCGKPAMPGSDLCYTCESG